MKRYFMLIAMLSPGLTSIAQLDSSTPLARTYDTVVITAFGKQLYKNIPYSIRGVDLRQLPKTPRLQLMHQLVQLPSMSSISSGSGINKPVIRGLSFNHIQLFAQGVRIDNQTWDDRHDLGVSENGFQKAELVSGPAALLYGPNTMGGALLLHDKLPAAGIKNGYAQLGFHGNTQGVDARGGFQQGTEKFYYSVDGTVQVHANYVQGKAGNAESDIPVDEDEDKPLAFNSKFTDAAFKGLIGFRTNGRTHEFSYNLYKQMLGIVEDESLEAINNPEKKEERDYEMEAPYQDVTTHIISTKNSIEKANHSWHLNAGYQFNDRKEYEPGAAVKSKVLGVGLKLQTITADLQYSVKLNSALGLTAGVQAFFQDNQNTGNQVLVPDAKIKTTGAYLLAHYDLPKWNFLAGARVDRHQLDMFNTPSNVVDTFAPPVPRPEQEISRTYTPFSASAGVVFHPARSVSLKFNLATGYTAPNYAQLTAYGRHEGTYRFEVGDNSLEMEKNLEADLGIVIDKPDFTITLTGYENSIRNYVYLQPTVDSVKNVRIYNWVQHDANISGLEFDLQWHSVDLKWIEAFLRAGITRGKLTNDAGDLPYIPASKLIAGVTLKKEQIGQWKDNYISLQQCVYGSQKNVSAFEQETDDYLLTDLFIGTLAPFGKKDRWTLTAFCTNIFNKSYFNHLSLIKSIGVREPGRNIGLQIGYNF
ncbi:MAG TPA: TonB-dependent receptor [Flavitalea sp.]|nr:TonB-dependent receptor [Flavitalea sp.]